MKTMRGKMGGAVLVLSMTALVPSVASAVGRHQTALYCQRYGNDANSSLILHDHGQSSANTAVEFLCPVMNDTNINVRNPTQALPVAVKVSGYSNGNNALGTSAVELSACHTSAMWNGGSCGVSTNVTTPGVFQDKTIGDLSSWSSAVTSDTDGFFVLAWLNAPSAGSYNVIWSYNVTR